MEILRLRLDWPIEARLYSFICELLQYPCFKVIREESFWNIADRRELNSILVEVGNIVRAKFFQSLKSEYSIIVPRNFWVSSRIGNNGIPFAGSPNISLARK